MENPKDILRAKVKAFGLSEHIAIKAMEQFGQLAREDERKRFEDLINKIKERLERKPYDHQTWTERDIHEMCEQYLTDKNKKV